MHNYDWAFNKVKLATAVEQLTAEKVELTEENLKERYIRLRGLLREDAPVEEETVTKRVRKSKKD